MRTIFITGSAGFIGFHTAKALLERGDHVIGLDELNNYYDRGLKLDRNSILLKYKNFHFIKGSITNAQLLKKIISKHNPNVVCHFAAQAGVRYSLVHPEKYFSANLDGFFKVLESIKNVKCKLVFASSSSVYGNTDLKKNGFSEETSKTAPISFYGATKLANEIMAQSYHHTYGIPTIGLRFFSIYGPWGRPDMAYYSFTNALFQHKEIEIYNNGRMSRDLTYIGDAIDAILAAIDKPLKFEIVNIARSQQIPLMKLIKTIESATGQKLKKSFSKAPIGDVKNTHGDIRKAKKLLLFDPKVSLQEGVKLFLEWYKSYYLVE